MLKVYCTVPNEKFNYESLINKFTYYILPSEDAIIAKRREHIFKYGSIKNIKFATFDDLIRDNIYFKSVDEVFKKFILSRILKKHYTEARFDGFINVVYDFFSKIIFENLSPKELINFKSEFIRSLKSSYEEYLNYFKTRDIEIDRGYSKFINSEIDEKNIIIDGFFMFRKSELAIIKKLSENSDIFINMPFNIKGVNIIDDEIKFLEDMGFDIIKSEPFLISKIKNIKILQSDNFYNMFFSESINLLNSIKAEELAVFTNSESMIKKIIAREDFYNIKFNYNKKNKSKIYFEFLDLLDFLQEKNKKNILKRIGMSYFNICEEKSIIEKLILREKFNDLSELLDRHSMKIEENEINIYLNVVSKLKNENILKEASISYYIEFFSYYLKSALDVIELDFKNLQNERLYRRDLFAIEDIELALTSMEIYKNYFEEISYLDFSKILKEYLANINREDLRNRETPRLINIDNGYYKKYRAAIFLGYDREVISKKTNFIFNEKNKADLEKYNLVRKESKISFIKFIYQLANLEKAVFLIEDEENLSEKLKLLEKNDSFIMENYENKYNPKIVDINNFVEKKDEENNLSKDVLEKLRTKLKSRNYSATDFDIYVNCPTKFLLERVFKLQELDRDYIDRTYLDRGISYHKILEKYFKTNREYNEEVLEQLILNEMFKKEIDKLTFLEYARFKVEKKYLKEFIQEDLERQRDLNKEPFEFEKKFNYKIADINIVGTIDRIDKVSDGIDIIDYKSSKNSAKSKKSIINKESFQLPIYSYAQMLLDRKIKNISYGIIRDGKYIDIIKENADSTEIENIVVESIREVKNIYNKMNSGDFPKGKNCGDCVYKDLCKVIKWQTF